MKFYMAPMEGLTGYIYRNAYASVYQDIDKFFAPFISSNHEGLMTAREKSDILPENNKGIELIPQILSCNAQDFMKTVATMKELGYTEINLNLGCPSGTVTAKGKGSGFLADPYALDCFLDEVYGQLDITMSVKTRIGYQDPNEFEDILEIYNKYPISELIIHPRTRKDMYKNTPNLEVFEEAASKSKNPLIYNGDIYTVEDYQRITERFPNIEGVMLGRGILKNPGLISEIKENRKASRDELRKMHDQVYAGYKIVMSGDRNVLFRMKEFWQYFGSSFNEPDKMLKKIRKAEKLDRYDEAVEYIFENL